MNDIYHPPFAITPAIVRLVAEIGEVLGRLGVSSELVITPRLRRQNRIRTIQASLAIEGNTLDLEQVTAILDGKRVLGLPREIQEVRNAIKAYEQLKEWNPSSVQHLLESHGVMMDGLVDLPGAFRTGGVGIRKGDEMVHIAPPAQRVPALIHDLLLWLEQTADHPLIAGCVFHYEFEFIHPFSDGNGRIGRLWQTLILSRWKPALACFPLESVVRERQADYYAALLRSDKTADSTPFVEFMLDALLETCRAFKLSDQVDDQVSDQVKSLLDVLKNGRKTAAQLMKALGLSHRPTFRKNYLHPALVAGLIEMTDPGSPNSPSQGYRLIQNKLKDKG